MDEPVDKRISAIHVDTAAEYARKALEKYEGEDFEPEADDLEFAQGLVNVIENSERYLSELEMHSSIELDEIYSENNDFVGEYTLEDYVDDIKYHIGRAVNNYKSADSVDMESILPEELEFLEELTEEVDRLEKDLETRYAKM